MIRTTTIIAAGFAPFLQAPPSSAKIDYCDIRPAPVRSEGNYRLYGPTHVERLQFIRQCRSLDMTLNEIPSFLSFRDVPDESCNAVNALLDKHIEHVAHRIRDLQALQKQLKALRSLCQTAHTTRDCEILQTLSTTENGTPINLGTHGGGCH